MKFTADEGVDAPIVKILRENGHDVFISPKKNPAFQTPMFWILQAYDTTFSLPKIKILENWFSKINCHTMVLF